jgi:diguanylate cyclase (GGDEF)-like protein/PAS domain S-box-containing protein
MRGDWHETIRVVVESATDAMIATDEAGLVAYANPSAEKLFASPLGGLAGRSISSLFDGSDADPLPHRQTHLPLVGSLQNGTRVTIASAEGRDRMVELSISEVQCGSSRGYLVIARDLSPHDECQTQLLESEDRTRSVLDLVPAGIQRLDAHQRITEANRTFVEMTGLEAAEVEGRSWRELIDPDQRIMFDLHWESLQKGESVQQAAYRLLHRSGRVSSVLVTAIPERDHNLELISVQMVILDVTSRLQKGRTLAEIEKNYDRLFERNLAGVYRATLDGRVLHCNDAFASVLGFPDSATCISSLVKSPWLDDNERERVMRRLQEDGSLLGIESGMLREDGVPVSVLQNLSLVETGAEPVVEATLFDITQRRLAEEKIAYQAHHDGLTGLANPVLFEKRVLSGIESARSSSHHLALMFIDLDDFKSVNDTMGHNVGNQLLQLVAIRLQRALRQGDTVARLGGDEFIVVLDGLQNIEDAEQVGRKILNHVSRPYLLDSREFVVTASIGIAVYPEDGADVETLMRNADIAMYRAKELGRNDLQMCSHDMSLEVVERMTLENDLRRAIERKEFVLHFQPQVDANTREIHALEALIRWQHPERGLVMPNDFIPVAERSRLMIPIGQWVLREACRRLASWNGLAPDLRVAVNLSPRQFQDEGFTTVVKEVLEETGLPPNRLELEVTEGAAMQNPEAALKILTELKAMGVRIAIDDFGTGYSSLSYLTKFPIDCLKIDQGFVRDIEKGGSESMIISAVIALAHQLRLTVIAEGVETSLQSQFLVDQHCQQMQGFLFSRPQPFESIELMLEQGLPN